MTARERAFYEFGRDVFDQFLDAADAGCAPDVEVLAHLAASSGLLKPRTDGHRCPLYSGMSVRPSADEPCGCLVPTYGGKS